MEKIIIAAVAENGVIGKDGELPWRFPEDMKHFRQKTMGKPVVMGRKTFQSLPENYRPLPGRKNIVLSRSNFSTEEDVKVVGSLEKAWREAEKDSSKVYVIGGSSVYEQVLSEAERMVITEIHDNYEGNSFFPEWKEENWKEVSRNDKEEFSFVEYSRL